MSPNRLEEADLRSGPQRGPYFKKTVNRELDSIRQVYLSIRSPRKLQKVENPGDPQNAPSLSLNPIATYKTALLPTPLAPSFPHPPIRLPGRLRKVNPPDSPSFRMSHLFDQRPVRLGSPRS